jgi:hypothetical protein
MKELRLQLNQVCPLLVQEVLISLNDTGSLIAEVNRSILEQNDWAASSAQSFSL